MKLVILLCAVQSSVLFAELPKSERVLSLADGELSEIHTVLGYSTLLQFDEKPMAPIVGDADSFRVEYLGNRVFVKPLVAGLSTNLVIFTQYHRFAFCLKSAKSGSPDLLLRIQAKPQQTTPTNQNLVVRGNPSVLVSIPVAKKQNSKSLALEVERISIPPSKKAIVIDFSISRREAENAASKRELNSRAVDFRQLEVKIAPHDFYLDGGFPIAHGRAVLRLSALKIDKHLTMRLATEGKSVSVHLDLKSILKKGGIHASP